MAGLTVLLLLLGAQQPPGPPPTPAFGDTVGYWQQRVAYTITATLDERAQRVSATGTLRYVNNSPDTLRELYLHQYLNAFRPGSHWSASDEREGRRRFQRLEEPDFGYERFTAPVRVNGSVVAVEYPSAPDSTVVRVPLTTRLLPGDSLLVSFAWDARPSVVPRRQARRGRQWDLAQWYPKVAVYDRGGWQANTLKPAGEFYGEFGTYDVTLIVRDDQVLAATGVPVSGDPGWRRVLRDGEVRAAAGAYGHLPPRDPPAVPNGHRAVRFFARDVHHFAWSASPDYRYDGASYVRPPGSRRDSRIPAWDTVAIHVLWRAGDDTTWGGLRVARRVAASLRWLEALFGPYPYPQLTAHHRIDGGASETPMLLMNGSPSLGLNLHEAGHMYAYGALANNEWREGWMDEGLTSYQTAWAQLLTPKERHQAGIVDRFAEPRGYRARAIRTPLPRFEQLVVGQALADLGGDAEPMGTNANATRDLATHLDMIYDRAEVMFSQLREVLGDSLFVAFLHDYYDRWALRHVDERALRASAERVSGRELGWFFDQWVRRTGVMDYALGGVRTTRAPDGGWLTEATVRRRGQYRQPVTVGVRTTGGWTLSDPIAPPYDSGTVRVVTTEPPLEVRVDPLHLSWDWDRRNDVRRAASLHNLDWPFLAQWHRERPVTLHRPLAWYGEVGGAVVGTRARGSYLDVVDRWEAGIASFTRAELPAGGGALEDRLQLWARVENPYWPWMRRPAMGWRAGVANVDGMVRGELSRTGRRAGPRRTVTHEVSLSGVHVHARELAPREWNVRTAADLLLVARVEDGDARTRRAFLEPRLLVMATDASADARAELIAGIHAAPSPRTRVALRGYAAHAPSEYRGISLSAADPGATFWNHWWRPDGAVLKQPGVHWRPLGGAGLRGYAWEPAGDAWVVSANGDVAREFARVDDTRGNARLGLRLHLFGDVARTTTETLSDAGVSLSAQGRVFDQDITVRLDAPLYVSTPALAIDRGRAGRGQFAPRWAIAFNDLW